MTLNFPGPYQVDIHYTVDDLEHVQKLSLDLAADPTPGDTFDTIQAVTRAGGNVDLDDAIDAWETILLPRFSSDCQFTSCELFKCNNDNFNRIWLSSYSMSGVGTHVSAYAPANEVVHTYRTQEGGIMKVTWEECPLSFFAKAPLGSASSYEATIRDFILSTSNWILARDTSYPIAALNLLYGQNEVIFRKRYR